MTINVRFKQSDMKVLLRANYIMDGSVVTKANANKKYTLRRSIKIYGENQKEITSDVDNVFLVDDVGNINMIPESTELMVYISVENLYKDLRQSLMWDDK